MNMETTDTLDRIRADLQSAGVRFLSATAEDGHRYLLVDRRETFRLLPYFKRHAELKGLVAANGTTRDAPSLAESDYAFLASAGAYFHDEQAYLVLCDILEDGRWHAAPKGCPISRIWPPEGNGDPFGDGHFLTPEAIVYVPGGSTFKTPELVSLSPATEIDVVYTWVNSDDPNWRAKKERHGGVAAVRSADHEYRFMSRDELLYSMRSVRKHAPWVRNIYIVTDDQHPSWLKENDRVKVVDHRDIFENTSDLPVFNSHAIEVNLHRIEGLSECFLYMNDDVFFGNRVTPSFFFDEEGRSVVYPTRINFIDPTLPEALRVPTDFAAYNMQALMKRDFGCVPTRKLIHAPFPLRRSVMQEICDRYRNEIRATSSSKLRAPTDLAVPSMLYHYYAWATGRAVLRKAGKARYKYFDTGKPTARAAVDFIRTTRPHFVCANATLHEEVALEEQYETLASLYRLYAEPCEFERPPEPVPEV